MKYMLNIDIDNKKLIYRYIPSGLIIIAILLICIWSALISQFGNHCISRDVSFLISDELKQSTNNLTANIVYLIQNKKYKDVKKLLSNDLGDYKTIKQSLEPVKNMLPSQTLQNIIIVGVDYETSYTNTARIDKISTVSEIQFPYSEFIVEMLQYRMGDQVEVAGIRFYPKRDVVDTFKASMSAITAKGYFAILMMLIILSTVIYALVLCINTDIERRKWLWIIFIMIGFFSFEFNWNTQSFGFNLFNISLLSVGWFKASCFSPLVLNFGIPIGALIFLYKQYRPYIDKLIK